MKNTSNELLCCPFCGGEPELTIRRERIGYGSYAQTLQFHVVICKNCDARATKYEQKPLCDYTNHTVSDFRDNPILRAVVEENYETYITQIKELAVEAWNWRHGGK